MEQVFLQLIIILLCLIPILIFKRFIKKNVVIIFSVGGMSALIVSILMYFEDGGFGPWDIVGVLTAAIVTMLYSSIILFIIDFVQLKKLDDD